MIMNHGMSSKKSKKTSIATSLHGGDPEVSIEAVNDWQAQAFVAGLQGHAAEATATAATVPGWASGVARHGFQTW
jgi:hypothetical protein